MKAIGRIGILLTGSYKHQNHFRNSITFQVRRPAILEMVLQPVLRECSRRLTLDHRVAMQRSYRRRTVGSTAVRSVGVYSRESVVKQRIRHGTTTERLVIAATVFGVFRLSQSLLCSSWS